MKIIYQDIPRPHRWYYSEGATVTLAKDNPVTKCKGRARKSLPVELVSVSVWRRSSVRRTRRDRDRDVNDNDGSEPDAETPVEVELPDIVWDEDSATDIVQLPGIPVVREVEPLQSVGRRKRVDLEKRTQWKRKRTANRTSFHNEDTSTSSNDEDDKERLQTVARRKRIYNWERLQTARKRKLSGKSISIVGNGESPSSNDEDDMDKKRKKRNP